MEVIDTLAHLNEGGVEGALNTMDAVGIDAVVLDEWSGFAPNGVSRPHRVLPNGALRWVYPFSQEATRLCPGRFKYNVKIDRNDPDWRSLVLDAAGDPHKVSVRISPRQHGAGIEALAGGEYDPILGLAQECELPVTLAISGDLQVLDRITRTFPRLRILLNHCGMLPRQAGVPVDREFPFRPLAEAMADRPGVHAQLCFAPQLAREPWPFPDLQAHLRRLISAVGAERLIWGSSNPIGDGEYSWAEDVTYLRAPGFLSDAEQEWILGKNARAFYRWPVSATSGRYRLPVAG